jgi:Leucine-rich repeat (LRR) protein
LGVLTNLEQLDLSHTGVTDKGLTHLHGLKKLRKLDLQGTKVTDTGIDMIRKMLPGLGITLP